MKFVFKICILINVLMACLLFSHPHLFINADPLIVFEGNRISRIDIEWTWGEMFSESILMDCDKNVDFKFDKEETQLVYKNYPG